MKISMQKMAIFLLFKYALAHENSFRRWEEKAFPNIKNIPVLVDYYIFDDRTWLDKKNNL